jgi:MYXO-CTERM domain-containing protein
MQPSKKSAVRALSLALVLFAIPRHAGAFTVNSALTEGCHEEISESALRAVRTSMQSTFAIQPSDDEKAFIDDLPLEVPGDMKDLAAASLIVGVRDNDLKGRAPTDIDQLAGVHGNPNGQEEHCLRSADQDEPDGTALALADCKTFIHDRTMLAISALDANGAPDAAQRMDIDVSLSLRGKVTANLPAFWVRIGQAVHALQDSFTHEYRTADRSHVTVTTNWIDFVNKVERESRDGPVHKVELDKCNGGDELRNRNRDLATEASTALFTIALDPKMTSDQKSAAVSTLLEKYLAYSPGCTYENAWCDAPENQYSNSACGCALVGGDGKSGLATLGATVIVVLAVYLRRRARRRGAAAGAAVLVALLGLALPARADSTPPPEPTAPPGTVPAPPTESATAPITPRTTEEVKEAVKEEQHAAPFAIAANLGGSIVNAAAVGAIGARLRLNDKFIVGVDGEVNYWFGVNNGRFEPGATSVYATGIYRIPMRYEPINLRTTVHAGVAIENVALYGVPSGSVGFFVGLYPLGLEWKLSGHVFLIFNPLGIAVPVPHLTGAPFGYPQFRTQVGVEIAL